MPISVFSLLSGRGPTTSLQHISPDYHRINGRPSDIPFNRRQVPVPNMCQEKMELLVHSPFVIQPIKTCVVQLTRHHVDSPGIHSIPSAVGHHHAPQFGPPANLHRRLIEVPPTMGLPRTSRRHPYSTAISQQGVQMWKDPLLPWTRWDSQIASIRSGRVMGRRCVPEHPIKVGHEGARLDGDIFNLFTLHLPSISSKKSCPVTSFRTIEGFRLGERLRVPVGFPAPPRGGGSRASSFHSLFISWGGVE